MHQQKCLTFNKLNQHNTTKKKKREALMKKMFVFD